MNASLRWLSELLGTPLEPAHIRDRLVMLGSPVDAMEPLHQDLGDIVIAEVLEVAPHPNADRLTLCKVNAGGEVKSVVCGATNVVAGRRYPYAPVGARLPNGMVLERRKIRGEYSDGMLCSARELGLGEDQEGILEVETDAAPGTRFPDATPVADTRFVLDVTPNRPDLLGHVGLARDLAAALGLVVKLPPFPGPVGPTAPRAARAPGSGGVTAGVPVSIEDAEGCPRYAAAVIRGVRVGPAPAWLRNRLAAVGARSINNVVDATNYLLYEINQPLHAFDVAKLGGPAIVVRRARPGETFVTLDGVQRVLDTTMTVIADAVQTQAIAGVMGGADSEVTPLTTDILLECAYFEPRRIRATRRTLGMNTEASYRFERGIDPEAVPENLARALDLLVRVAGGRVDGTPVDVIAAPPPPRTVFLRDARVAHVLGVEIPRGEIERVLTALGCTVAPKRDRLAVQVASYRPDLTREIDLIEEVARIVGYERFPSDMRPFRVGVVPDALSEQAAGRLRQTLTGLGLHEAMTSPLGPKHDARCVAVLNPLSQEEGYLRAALLPALVRRVEHNWRMSERNVRLFEVGNVFAPPDAGAATETGAVAALPHEALHVAAVVTGARRPPHWSEPAPPDIDLFDAKALLEAAVAVGHRGATIVAEGTRLVAKAGDGAVTGWAGELAAERPPWGGRVFGFELLVRPESAPEPKPTPRPRWPAVERDVALVLPDGLPAADLEGALAEAAGPQLERLWVFDEYRGAPLVSGTRSVAWRLVFRAADRTLRDAEVDATLARAVAQVERRYGVRRREA